MLTSPALAQTTVCGMSGQGAVGSTATYDPFNPSGLASTQVTLTLTRFNPPGGSRTEHVRFILRAQNASANGMIITPVSIGSNATLEPPLLNVFYNFGATSPTLAGTPSAANRFAHIEFTGNNPGSDTVNVVFSVQFPANLNLNASQNLSFDLEYTCNAQPGNAPGGGTLPNQMTFPIVVLSGLQASYIGPALAFGEVGDKTDAQAIALTPPNGNIRVASSGPYTIAMTSANNYRMTYPTGNLLTETQILRYQATFLGQTRDPTNVLPITKTCVRAGLGAPPLSGGINHPVSVQLLEGGLDEVPAPNYQDILTVTVTPLAALTPGVTCP